MIRKADMTEQQAARATAIIRSIGRTCSGRIVQERDEEGNVLKSSPCGYDFNNVVVDGDWDGKERSYQCPRCKVKGTYRAPFFNGDDLT